MADTIRILVATDNHVGYNERDAVRGDDSWKTFDEIMTLAKDRDVDMVLLAGDLFHENVPSRKSMYNVMRALRQNCYGDKPCELQILSDGSQHFDIHIGHANYEDADINVAIPVFSIHGNHDDPSGNGHYAALDILEMAGLLNYFGRTPESDNIHVNPVLLQKGNTKLALYGLSNVREERMYRTFREEKVHFYQPKTQTEDWYNIACVHQNHHAHTATSYLPENFLPTHLDLVIWGHEHECDIEPRLNQEMGFRVMQPGSSVATSLNPGEAVPKQVAILSVTGREMKCEKIPLKTIRPFMYKEIILSQEKEAVKIAKGHNHRHKLTEWLQKVVEGLIEQARKQWEDAQAGYAADDDDEEVQEFPLPLIRLRVETSPYDMNTKFEIENPQRFSNRFTGRVANHHDVVQFHMRKRAADRSRKALLEEVQNNLPDTSAFSTIRVSELVEEYLSAQSLSILPQDFFGDALVQYIDKDDKHAVDTFVNDALSMYVKQLVSVRDPDAEEEDEDGNDLAERIDEYRSHLEELFKAGKLKNRARGKSKYKPKPDGWDSDVEGEWEDQPAAIIRSDDEDVEDDDMLDDEDDMTSKSKKPAARGGRGRGRGTRANGTTARGGRGTTRARAAAATATATARGTGRGKKKVIEEDSEDGDDDIIMHEDDEEAFSVASGFNHSVNGDDDDILDDDSQAMFFPDTKSKSKSNNKIETTAAAKQVASTAPPPKRGSRAASTSTVNSTTVKSTARKAAAPVTRKAPARAAVTAAQAKQSTLNFSASQASVLGVSRARAESIEISDDDDDAFEPMSTARSRR